jgi:hypothetical protein
MILWKLRQTKRQMLDVPLHVTISMKLMTLSYMAFSQVILLPVVVENGFSLSVID